MSDRRRYPRSTAEIPVVLRVHAGRPAAGIELGTTEDVSAHGARVLIREPRSRIQPGDALEASFHPRGAAIALEPVPCVVRRVEHAGRSLWTMRRRVCVAVEFAQPVAALVA